jgi:ParB-like chromosome segregation protein Spo0J
LFPDPDTIDVYGEILDKLPPIIVNKNKLLIDGHHTIFANKEKGVTELDAEVLDIPDNKVFEESIRRNIQHGKNLTKEDRKKSALILCTKGVELKQIADMLAISYSSVVKYTEELRTQEQREKNIERDKKIDKMMKAGKTQEKIAKKLGLDQSRISQIISKNNFINPNSNSGKDGFDVDFGDYDNLEEPAEPEPTTTTKTGCSFVCEHCGKRFILKEEKKGSSTKHRIESC